MTDSIESAFSLFATIIGLIGCLFRYIKAPKRGYLYLIGFFLASFFSDFYWTIYTLVMHDWPEVSEFLAYIGWNVGYVLLLLAVLRMRPEGSRRYFHPLMLWPVVTNVPQFLLYVQYGGLFNNLWQVGVTTLTMVFCMQGLLYYRKNRKNGEAAPWVATLVLVFMILEYAMWTVSCFDWPGDWLNPYLYCSLLRSLSMLAFAWAAGRHYGGTETNGAVSWTEFRFQAVFQVAVSVLVGGACAGGYALALRSRNAAQAVGPDGAVSGSIVTALFVISAVLILLILLLLYTVNRHYRKVRTAQREPDSGKSSRFNFLLTIGVTLVLMVFALVYNSRVLYKASVSGIYEDGKDVISATATDLESYLTVAQTTLRVTADTVDLMEQAGASPGEILQYLTEQTTRQSEQFDENFTGLYAYIGGQFMDGSGWVPPEDYDAASRDWYLAVAEAGGEVVIVSPYLDAQTGSVVITVGKRIYSADPARPNVVCLDVIVNHVQEVAEQVNVSGKGYGMVANSDGFIVAHRDQTLNGQTVAQVYGAELQARIVTAVEERFQAELEGEDCTIFTDSIMGQWVAVIVVDNTELLENVYSQLAVNIIVFVATFWLISFFYYYGYKIEQNNSRKVEEMSVQVVTALAEAIDAKDAYTNGHSSRVAKYARMIAARAGYSEAEQSEIYMMGLLHDIGKIGVPDGVINKPGPLTEGEFALIRSHPAIGGRILESIKERPKLSTGARWHHERYGGGGYPDGIAGEAIPEEARIIAVADAYDAMTSRRSYRSVMSQDRVRREIQEGSGTQFDPRFAKIMLDMIDADPDYTLREK